MLRRKISTLLERKLRSGDKTIIVDGARQVGKSFIIRYVGSRLFDNFVEVNFYDDKVGRRLFEDVSTLEDFYLRLSTIENAHLGNKQNTLVFLDEIQVYPQFLTMLKFLHDEGRFTYIASGSQLGIALNETLSKPAGRVEVLHMFPLDFEEFLWANGVGEDSIGHVRLAFFQQTSLEESIHSVYMDLFKRYLLVGGLPDAVNAFIDTHNLVNIRAVHDAIYQVYREDAAQYDSENKLKIRRVYDLVPSYLENKKKRVQFNDIEQKRGRTFASYEDEFEYLVESGITLEVKAVSNPRFPLEETMTKNLLKLYLNDVGLLTNVLYRTNADAILKSEASINLGSVYESVVASELRAHGCSLYYYDNKSKGEVDFIVNNFQQLSVLPIEVKSGKDYSIHRSLTKFVGNPEYHVLQAYVLSNDRLVRVEENILYMPVYYICFFEPFSKDEVII